MAEFIGEGVGGSAKNDDISVNVDSMIDNMNSIQNSKTRLFASEEIYVDSGKRYSDTGEGLGISAHKDAYANLLTKCGRLKIDMEQTIKTMKKYARNNERVNNKVQELATLQ